MTGPLRDADIRQVLDADLRAHHTDTPGVLIRHELGLCAGARRVDLAVISDEQMTGYEIKSDTDTLARLAGQAKAYGQVFDRMVLVATDRHLDRALDLLPPWWEILRAAPAPGGPVLEQLRAGAPNPDQEAFALAQVLWREEALAELRARGLAKGLTGARRWILWRHLAQALPTTDLARLARSSLRTRTAPAPD